MNKLEQLRAMTIVVADTGDLSAIRKLKPTDATTNPSLLLKAAGLPQFAEQVALLRVSPHSLSDRIDRFAVSVGTEISRVIPGMISTEVDASLSFDTAATIARAEKLISLYGAAGVELEKILIKRWRPEN